MTQDQLTTLVKATDEQMEKARTMSDGAVEVLQRLADEERGWADRAQASRYPTARLLEQRANDYENTLALALMMRSAACMEDMLRS
jgi:hypothetical protein